MAPYLEVVQRIERWLRECERGEISVDRLQENVEGELGAVEELLAPRLFRAMDVFVNRLELFRFSVPEDEQMSKAREAILFLREEMRRDADDV